ncbi:MAG: hypothetical protein COA73_16505 [Candidatus Hydrogenedentota bacterium]|nr:MAG: hypothetical protein COA73_16505 [Candidatus Hydrogenedentota bacterium]
MKSKLVLDSAIQWVVVATLVVLLSVIGFQAWGQSALWDRDEVQSFLDHNPGKAVGYLEAVLTPEQQTELWGLMFPPPSASQLELGYGRIKRELKRLQLKDSDTVVVEVGQRLDALKAAPR